MFNLDDDDSDDEDQAKTTKKGGDDEAEYQYERGAGRKAQTEEFKQEIKTEMEASEKLVKGLRDEMKGFKDLMVDADKFETQEDAYYMECFPQYEEVDFQASIKDHGNGKRMEDNENRLNGQILKRLTTEQAKKNKE